MLCQLTNHNICYGCLNFSYHNTHVHTTALLLQQNLLLSHTQFACWCPTCPGLWLLLVFKDSFDIPLSSQTFYNTPEATNLGYTIQKFVETLSTLCMQPTEVTWSLLDGHELNEPGLGCDYMAVVAVILIFLFSLRTITFPSAFQNFIIYLARG